MDLTSKDLTGAAIRVLRHMSGYTSEGLAYESGVARSTVSKMEHGAVPVTKPAKAKIAAVLGLTVEEIDNLERELSGYHNKMKNSVSNTPGWPVFPE